MEDITDPELLAKDSLCNRRVCLYGYARAGALKRDSFYHIPGKKVSEILIIRLFSKSFLSLNIFSVLAFSSLIFYCLI